MTVGRHYARLGVLLVVSCLYLCMPPSLSRSCLISLVSCSFSPVLWQERAAAPQQSITVELSASVGVCLISSDRVAIMFKRSRS